MFLFSEGKNQDLTNKTKSLRSDVCFLRLVSFAVLLTGPLVFLLASCTSTVTGSNIQTLRMPR